MNSYEELMKEKRLPKWAVAARIGINRSRLDEWLSNGDRTQENAIDQAITYLSEHPDWRKTYIENKEEVINGTFEENHDITFSS